MRKIGSIRNRLSSANVLAMVRSCGREPAGAFSLLSQDGETKLSTSISPVSTHLSDDELAARVTNRSSIPFSFWHGRFYQSLAGTQDKMQVGMKEGNLYLLGGSLSSTHIIKPEACDPATPFMVANEHYCMSLAAAMSLPVAQVHIRRIPDPILVIERFDRVWNSKSDILQPGNVERVHAIDGCQAVGAASWEKYEQCVENQSFGVGFKRLFKLAPFFVNPEEGRLFIIRWALFSLLIGNNDAHAKNISFFQTNDGLIPAPMYDLTSTQVYGDVILQNLAVSYGRAFRFEDVTQAAMIRFSEDANFSSRLMALEMDRLAAAAQRHYERLVDAAIYSQRELALVSKISDVVRTRIDWMKKMADCLLVRKPALRGAP